MKNFLKRFLPVPAKTHHEQMQMLATHMQHMDDHLKKLYEAMGSVRSRVARIDSGATTIFVSHSTNQMRMLCNKILWMEHGKQRAFGATNEIMDMYEAFLDGKTQ